MARYLLRVGYIGTKYRGIQRISDFPHETVQGVLEDALAKESAGLAHFASRTDKGVHALANALHVDVSPALPPHLFICHLNRYLRDHGHEILISNVTPVHSEFDARRHAKWRSYVYRLAILVPEIKIPPRLKFNCEEYLPVCEINRCHIVSSDINIDLVSRVVEMFRGHHNFATFTKYLKRDPWRDANRTMLEASLNPVPSFGLLGDLQYQNVRMWEFHFKAKAFLYHQVRKMVGTALAVGHGDITLNDVQYMLDNPDPNNWTRCKMAPPWGLYLTQVHYDLKDFFVKKAEDCDHKTLQEEVCLVCPQ